MANIERLYGEVPDWALDALYDMIDDLARKNDDLVFKHADALGRITALEAEVEDLERKLEKPVTEESRAMTQAIKDVADQFENLLE